MGSTHGIISSVGSVTSGVILGTTLIPWKSILGVIFIICGLLSFIDYVRYGGEK